MTTALPLTRGRLARICLTHCNARQWVTITTGSKANGPPVAGHPQMRFVAAGAWESRCWTAKGSVTFTGPTPKSVLECVL